MKLWLFFCWYVRMLIGTVGLLRWLGYRIWYSFYNWGIFWFIFNIFVKNFRMFLWHIMTLITLIYQDKNVWANSLFLILFIQFRLLSLLFILIHMNSKSYWKILEEVIIFVLVNYHVCHSQWQMDLWVLKPKSTLSNLEDFTTILGNTHCHTFQVEPYFPGSV